MVIWPYKIVRKVGEVAYELDFPEYIKVHNVFHVSCLKKAIRQQVTVLAELPPLDYEGKLILVPNKILQTREKD